MRTNRFRNLCLRIAAFFATRNSVPESYSLTDTSRKRNNFAFLRLGELDEYDTAFVATGLCGSHGMVGRLYRDNYEKSLPGCLTFDHALKGKLKIRRVYGEVERTHTSICSYIRDELTLTPRLLLMREIFEQRRFNRAFRFSAERMGILKALIDWQRRSGKEDNFFDSKLREFHLIDAFNEIYSGRIWGHENYNQYLNDFEFAIESLVESGDIRKSNNLFIVTGRSLITLSRFEEENRRYSAQSKQNMILLFLTAVIAVSGIVSAVF